MSWIRTYAGRKFYPLDPRPGDICIEDIAHHLSQINRFTGALRETFSVAQHSLLVSDLVPEEDKLWGMLHDGSEAYTSDVNKPLKEHLPDFKAAETAIMKAIAQKFGLQWPMPCSVKKADMIALVSEAFHHMPSGLHEWQDFGVAPLAHHKLLVPMTASQAEREFIREFNRLDKYRMPEVMP